MYTRNRYLNMNHVAVFSQHLSVLLEDGQLGFVYNDAGENYRTLRDAVGAYAWPAKRTTVCTPGNPTVVQRWQGFRDNNGLLHAMHDGLGEAFRNRDEHRLFQWVRAILQWGGVYKYGRRGTGGNRGWLETEYQQRSLYRRFEELRRSVSKEIDEFGRIQDLRSNAGLTKVHSLLFRDFIIYDARVAAALAWLVMRCFEGESIPEDLKFSLPPSQGNHCRNPTSEVFRATQNDSYQHMKWNIRANWILSDAVQRAAGFHWSLRQVEAALFVLGYDLRYAL